MPSRRPRPGLTEAELRAALVRINGTSDMLPPREDDKVAGRIADGFARGLEARIVDGSYTPVAARFVPVPKQGLSTRPAAIVALRDRVVLEAWVERARPRIERRLLPGDTVLWPRGTSRAPAFNELDSKPLATGGGYIVFGDVAGFYESVIHSQLGIELANAGVATEAIDAIIDHLGKIMGSGRGLPQGVASSDSLATLYLAPVDASLREAGVTFWRHGDDYRIAAPTWPEVMQFAHIFEAALRRSGLLANSRKLQAMHFSKYAEQDTDLDRATVDFRSRMEAARLASLETMDDDELAALVADVGLDEDIQWRYFYHHNLSLQELKDALAPSLTPQAMEIIEAMFRDVVSSSTGLPPELRHARLVYCLRRMAAAKSPAALAHAGDLLLTRADETQDVCNYLLSLVGQDGAAVAAACQYALTNSRYLTDWQQAWILRVLSRCTAHASSGLLAGLERAVEVDSTGWLSRIEMARVLAASGRLARNTAIHLNAHCGEALKVDLLGVIAAHEDRLDWAGPFLEGAIASDDLARVVITAVREKSRQGS